MNYNLFIEIYKDLGFRGATHFFANAPRFSPNGRGTT